MQRRIRILLIIMLAALTMLLGLQTYLSVADYQRKKVVFTNDLDSLLHEALSLEFEHRLDTLSNRFLEDLRDTTIVEIQLGKSNEGYLTFHFKDPGDPNLYTSISLKETQNAPSVWTDSLRTSFEKGMVNQIRDDLSKNVVMYWTDTLGTRIKESMERYPVDTSYFHRVLDSLALEAGISSTMNVDWSLAEATSPTAPTGAIRRSQPLPYSLYDADWTVHLTVDNPAFDIVRRSLITILGSLGVIVLTVWCFYLLFRTILRQKKLSDLKDDFIDNVTHELQTPISAIRMSHESMERLPLDSDRHRKYLNVAQTELARLGKLVDRLLNRSWQESKSNRKQIDLDDFLRKHIERLKMHSTKPIQTDWPETSPPDLNTDPALLDIILENLLQNALKYSDPEGVRLYLNWQETADDITLSIADDGWGIPSSDRPYIFDKFTRSSDTNRNYSVKGLGVGLYHVKKCVEALDGHIEVTPNQPRGSVFTLNLPNHA
jgi:two-component system, OmpR family, phosphate regulon sensor histidine kinase PhoR